MKQFLTLIVTAIAAVFLAPFRALRGAQYQFANIAEGERHTGNRQYLADGAFSSRFLLAKIGSDADHVTTSGTGDIPIGIITDQADAAEDPVNVRMLGSGGGTARMQASAAISAGDFVVAAASGKVRTLPGTTGTYYIVGRALQAASADGDLIEVVTIPCVQRVVP